MYQWLLSPRVCAECVHVYWSFPDNIVSDPDNVGKKSRTQDVSCPLPPVPLLGRRHSTDWERRVDPRSVKSGRDEETQG